MLTATATLREIADLPGPRGWPLVGNLPQVDRKRIHQAVERWSREYGPYFKFSLGRVPLLAVSDHDAIVGILRDRPEGFRRAPRSQQAWLEAGLPSGVFGAEGDVWRRQRRMVMAAFDPAHVRAYFPALKKVLLRLERRWQGAARESQSIPLQVDLMRYTVDAITGLAFGADINTLEGGEDVIQGKLDKIFPAIFRRAIAPFDYWRYVKLPADRALEESVPEVNAAVERFIATTRERMKADPTLFDQPSDLLEALLAASAKSNSGLSDADVAGNVLTMLLAGEDTTANTLAWMLHLLHRHPATLERARDEVLRVAPDPAEFTVEQMNGLDFVEACAHETMRLKPVAPFLPLQALRDTTIGDVRVPRGTIIWVVLRKESVSEQRFADAESFVPERWLGLDPTASIGSAKRVSMPFGGGPRVCPGRYLALLEIKLAIAMILARFEIASVDAPHGGLADERLEFTMAPVGLTLRLRERAAVPVLR